MNSARPFSPRFLTAPQYIFALHEPDDQVAVLVRNRIRQQTLQRILPAGTIASPPIQAWLFEQNLSGADIFIGMNPVKEGSRYRRKEQIREIRHVYLDLDEEAGASLQAIRSSADLPPPNFVLDSSPGRHQVVWKIEGAGPSQAEQLLRALALEYGGDPAATDITRLLRLPGFANRKYRDPFLVRAQQESDCLYHLEEFRVQEESRESLGRPAEWHSPGRGARPGHHSQSESDWAYAKRALLRGDGPEQVIRRIADYRAEEKADPHYYARLTVRKAQIALASPEQPTAESRPKDRPAGPEH